MNVLLELLRHAGSVVQRAVAVGMAYGPAAGLEVADTLANEPALRKSHRLPSVRGDLLFRAGRFEEAQAEFERAAALPSNAQERRMLLDRAASKSLASKEPSRARG